VTELFPPEKRPEPYPSSTLAAGALATLFFPLLLLIAALFLMGREQDAGRRSTLRTWAFVSVGWIAAQIVLAIVLFAAVASSTSVDRSGPCQGGPEIGASGEVRPDGTTVFPCEFGGTVTIRFR
jgi:hypothetical protein